MIATITVTPGKRFSDHSDHPQAIIVVVAVIERKIREGVSVIHRC